ncbi:carbohydrate ABC transporter permease [Evansella cellulosilytica]|uniref:Binding-protein-dependent transport systems inner membrane component n=1 Tax=Evansella cellulosilytica (strain ATCC 21833 / DSM 2522 / FERM P-1141 / JCM 9156 / N-4) TaxID=649639 RepID=E6TXM6_EVAC2|nr:carbohydrate ABC transporter permease [Evansella cellulosilytica]ADU28840.1 binding-protein-dependent transport systems inner membrane component [Evansella cellulosilytica DSM 2522]
MGRIGYIFLYVCLGFVALFQIFPIVWLFLFSLKDNREIFAGSPFALPEQIKWQNYLTVWEGGIGNYFWNSIWITGVSIFLTLLFASMAVFVITRMSWKLNKLVLGLFMVGLMIPIHSALIPLFSMFLGVGLIDNPLSIVITYTAYNLPITMMILLGFYYTIPKEIEEAAIIDGASLHKLFFRIILPITSPVLATTAIINMIYNWNEFVFVNTFISSDRYRTLTVGINNFVGQYMTDWGAIGATLVISVLPIIVAFLFFSNKIVEGISSSAVKG